MDAKIIKSGIYGVAVGDALGVPFEFKSRLAMDERPCTGMTGFGTHGKPAGTWSDDTSMTLATADGLCEFVEGGYKPVMDRFYEWFQYGKYTVDGLFDMGNTCAEALIRYEEGEDPVTCGGRDRFDNGNGSLMRILPAVLFDLGRHGRIDLGFISDMSALTHGHEISKTACRIFALVAESVINGEPLGTAVPAAVKKANIKKLPEFDRLLDGEFSSLPRDRIKSGGYVVETLEAALWCLGTTDNYRDCVLAAANLGGDPDTTAAVAGGLAGLKYGFDGIPPEFIGTLLGREVIDDAIEKLSAAIVCR